MDLTVGLIKGRHTVPVNDYIFNNAIEDVHDYYGMACEVIDYIYSKYGKTPQKATLTVYVTGLTSAMLSIVMVCNDLNKRGWNITLNAAHYDTQNNKYIIQEVLA